LRIKLNANDAFIPVKEKYNNNYWISKRKPEQNQKRIRELDDADESNDAKRLSSTPEK